MVKLGRRGELLLQKGAPWIFPSLDAKRKQQNYYCICAVFLFIVIRVVCAYFCFLIYANLFPRLSNFRLLFFKAAFTNKFPVLKVVPTISCWRKIRKRLVFPWHTIGGQSITLASTRLPAEWSSCISLLIRISPLIWIFSIDLDFPHWSEFPPLIWLSS